VYGDKKVEVPCNTREHQEYMGGELTYACYKKCHEFLKMNLKEF
jgi:hypothetical protein